ncbi:MAG TPA: GDSL-type esterase/lipase family protein [Terriglobales bacterium]|nr:GDSL-type esterase/lipase family protein [Terriglobales bacterium]
MEISSRIIRVRSTIVKALAACSLIVPLASSAQTTIATAPNPATIPTDLSKEPWWAARHKALVEVTRSHPDTQLLLIGDSITNNYDKAKVPDENFQPVWKQFYEPRKALNLGFSGDTTAHVIWRLDHGEVDGLHPKVAVLLIGTNNTSQHNNHTAEQTEAGIDAVISDLENRLPETKILLLGILPSDISDTKTERDLAVNAYLATCYSENPRVTFLNINSVFYKNGELNSALFYDPRLPQHGKALHPDTVGQRMMAEAIEPALAHLMDAEPRVPLAAMTDINTAVIPVPRLEMDDYDWYARHHAELEIQKKVKPQVVLIGDSITHFWGGSPNAILVNGPTAWQRVFADMPAINMGFGWDRTQNVLWRLRQGEFEGLTPKWVVLMIGTNNFTGTENARSNTPEEIVEGMDAICREIRKRSPESHIILMAILPRGQAPNSPLRAPIQKTNQLLSQRFSNDSSVTYLDIGTGFLQPDGSLLQSLMPDGTHPSDAGYQIWADALIKAGVKAGQ